MAAESLPYEEWSVSTVPSVRGAASYPPADRPGWSPSLTQPLYPPRPTSGHTDIIAAHFRHNWRPEDHRRFSNAVARLSEQPRGRPLQLPLDPQWENILALGNLDDNGEIVTPVPNTHTAIVSAHFSGWIGYLDAPGPGGRPVVWYYMRGRGELYKEWREISSDTTYR